MPKGLYIHIPFCDHICTYCDFPKLMTKGQHHEGYLEALIEELKYYEQQVGFRELQTVFIGGGTPTALTISQLEPLFRYLKQAIDFKQIKEVSIEANPENLTQEKVDFLLSQGITRMSLGVQTFDSTLLKEIGRKHTSSDVKDAIKRLKVAGLTNINLDLIYGIPGQTLAQVQTDLEIAMSLDIAHISAYSLIVEEHTLLYLDYMKDQVVLTDNELEANMYEWIINQLALNGFKQYEISNFTKDLPSLHNQWYWLNEEYIGVGLGAHGYISGSRYQNTRSINSYIQRFEQGKLPIVDSHVVSSKEKLEEEMFLGLRLMQGIHLEEVNDKYGIKVEEIYGPVLKELVSRGYLEQEAGRIRLSPLGKLMANEVFEQFLL